MKVSMKGRDLVFDFIAETERKCGDCALCCKLLPVRELHKRGGERCRFQRHRKGCTIYHRPDKGFPPSCGLWSCVWLSDPGETGTMRRPDHAHYVVDPLPDFIVVRNESMADLRINVVQVWLDPAYPEAHRDPGLRAFLAMRGRRDGFAALIRLNESDGWVLLPPTMTPDGQWHERGSRRRPEDCDVVLERSPDEIYH
ncbi:hypothetical protein SmedWSM1115_08015 [Sinorhizobium medicae WSM1115]|uniref:hypothetical protein n=1 Tax=Sinorhizobium medicae TaxID=110321 RepID=UPI00037EFC2A|nr:hypothetical protein [Sinorhizobium medicae]UFX03583.1 hypothetical protein SmedWSM1115_08015 [Sinorhizobium medicae WSM1115]